MIQYTRLGYEVIGLERNEESVKISKDYIESCGVDVKVYQCDFLKKDMVDLIMSEIGQIDACLLLLIPISIHDYSQAVQNMSRWIKPGGIFVADNFDYLEGHRQNGVMYDSNIEVAESKQNKSEFAVRMNYYEYRNNLIYWDAIYFYHEEGKLQMKRDHDILDVIPESESCNCLELDSKQFEILPNYRVVECEEGLAPPHLYEYLIGRRKRI